MCPRGWLGASVVILLVGGAASAVDAAPIDRVSEYAPSANEAWGQRGFRIQLRFGLESIEGLDSGRPLEQRFSFAAEPGVRLGRWASMAGTLRYTVLPNGMRWTNTADLSLHLVHGLYLAGGVGYGGLLTLGCSGGGVAHTMRLGWLIPMGQVFSMGPSLQCDWQGAVDCEAEPGRASPAFEAVNFSWAFGWR